ncbi:906_t:CDS:2, partial [Scutellospora calospora]
GRGVLLAWLLTESSDCKSIRAWLHTLKSEQWIDLVNVILDNDNAEINAICEITKKIEKDQCDNLYHNLEQLLYTKDINRVDSVLVQFKQKWKNTYAL